MPSNYLILCNPLLLLSSIFPSIRVPWTARRSNQSILKEISPEYSLEGLTVKLNLQYFGHLMQRANSLKRSLMLQKIEGWRRVFAVTSAFSWQNSISLCPASLCTPRTNLHITPGISGEGNGNPLQYSCLANPIDGGAWYAAVHGVARSRT